MPRPVVHRSSLVVTAIAAIALARINTNGNFRDLATWRIPYRAPIAFEHGWPVAYMTRSFAANMPPPGAYAAAWLFVLAPGEVRSFSSAALALDVLVAAAIAAGATTAWEWRRRRRSHACQVKLSEMLLAVGVVASLCGWLAYQREQYRREQRHLRALSSASAPYAEEFGARFDYSLAPAAPDWFVRLGGEWTPIFLLRCNLVHVVYGSDQAYDGFADAASHLRQLKKLRVLTVSAPSSRRPIPFDDIAELSQLRVLDLSAYVSDESETWRVLPSELENLQSLDRLVLPTRASLPEAAARVLRENMPHCEVIFADEEKAAFRWPT